ncbi:MAG: hypothetical protein WBC44_19585 [Planctomycetaceae bacterium]
MSPRQFADLAAVVARHAEELGGDHGPDDVALHRVWTQASRCLRLWREELTTGATPRLYADLFAAETLLRAWCTAVSASPRRRSAGKTLAEKVFGELLDVRCFALQALAADHGLTVSEAALVDRFRRRCERWTDALLASLAARSGVTDYAVRPDRALDFASSTADPYGAASWPLILTGLRLAFAPAEAFRGVEMSRNDVPAAELAAAILASFPPTAFAADGCLIAPALARMGRVVREVVPERRRPRSIDRPAALGDTPTPIEPSPFPAEASRPAPGISFASLRKRRPAE